MIRPLPHFREFIMTVTELSTIRVIQTTLCAMSGVVFGSINAPGQFWNNFVEIPESTLQKILTPNYYQIL